MPTTTQPRTWAQIKADPDAADQAIGLVAAALVAFLRDSENPVIRRDVERYDTAQNRSRELLAEPASDIEAAL